MNKVCTILRACGKEVSDEAKRPLRPSYFSKFKCAASLLKPEYGGFTNPGSDVHIVWDGPRNEFCEYLTTFKTTSFTYVDYQSNQKSLNQCYDLMNAVQDSYVAFFLSEDDHTYLPGSFQVLAEGLSAFKGQFIALGDHRHRYAPNNGDIISTDGVFLTKSAHWRTADSYVFSFGFSRTVWQEFESDFRLFNDSGIGAVRDRDFFHNVITRNRRLLTPIPGLSTHLIKTDLSPVIDWAGYHESIEV